MDYIIRRKEQNDCYGIAHVVTVAWNETYKGIVTNEFLENLKENKEQRAINSYNNFNVNDNHQFVLEVNNEIVGFINVGMSEEKEYINCGEIFALYILSDYKGKGYGRKLVDTGVEELKKIGCNKMIIGCLDGNPSNEFYKHIGGVKIKTRIFEKLNLPENVYLFEEI